MSKLGIEVFQDLTLASAEGDLSSTRAALINHQTCDWVRDSDQEADMRKHTLGGDDIILFRYVGADLPRACLL